jgi:hypothetical protein
VCVCAFQNVYGAGGWRYRDSILNSMTFESVLVEMSYINGPLGCVRLHSYIYPEYLFK